MLVLVGTALATRFAWYAALASRQPQWDEFEYLAHAVNLADGKGYIDSAGQPTAYWPVGYPAVLAASVLLVGRGPLTGMLLQVLLGTATCVLVSHIGTSALGVRVGRVAALFLAVYPTHVAYASLYLTEPLFTLLLTASAALLLNGLARSTASTAWGGLVIGLAALVRPVVLLLPLALPLWYWRRQFHWGRVLARTLIAGACTLLAVSPWLARNHAVTGDWTTITVNGGHNFWIGNRPGALGGYPRPEEFDEINEPLRTGSHYNFARGYPLGLAAIAAAPLSAGVRALQKVSYFFALETDGVLWNLKGLATPPSLAVTLALLGLANAAYLLMLSFAVLGLMGTPRRHPLASLFLVLTGYLVALSAAFIGDPRFHYALVPLAMIFTAKGWLEDWPVLWRGARRNEPGARRRLLAWGTIGLVFLALMVANLWLKAIEFGVLGS